MMSLRDRWGSKLGTVVGLNVSTSVARNGLVVYGARTADDHNNELWQK